MPPRISHRLPRFRLSNPAHNRPLSSQPQGNAQTTTPATASPTTKTTKKQPPLERLIARLPPRLRPAAARLRTAPGSHVAAFLLLHEITAVVPLLGLFGLVHWAGEEWVPLGWVGDRLAPQLSDGMVRFEQYFRRKGWFGLGREEEDGVGGRMEDGTGRGEARDALETLREGEGGYRVVAEVALAYAITKALMPVRIIVSLWATPWLARGFVQAQAIFRRPTKP